VRCASYFFKATIAATTPIPIVIKIGINHFMVLMTMPVSS
jgi:hypothetical protein